MTLANLKWTQSKDKHRWYTHSSCGRKVFSVEPDPQLPSRMIAYVDYTILMIGDKLDVEAAILWRNEELKK